MAAGRGRGVSQLQHQTTPADHTAGATAAVPSRKPTDPTLHRTFELMSAWPRLTTPIQPLRSWYVCPSSTSRQLVPGSMMSILVSTPGRVEGGDGWGRGAAG